MNLEHCRLSRSIPWRAWTVIQTAALVCGLAGPAVAQTVNRADTALKYFKLHASAGSPYRTGIRDSVWRYFGEQGALAFMKKDYPSAEKFYNACLQGAEKGHIEGRNLVLILANLAATYREERKYNQSELMFKRALSASEKLETGETSPYAYTLRQYAVLLQKTGREREAQFAYETAQNGSRLLRQSVGVVSPKTLDNHASVAEQKREEQPQQPLAAVNRFDFGDQPSVSTEAQPDEPVIVDCTVIGFTQISGQAQPNTQVFAHSRTYLTGPQADWLRAMVDHLRPSP